MSNSNQLQYFVSQSYRQVQLSVDKGTKHYAYSDFAHQFDRLLEASHDEDYARALTIQLVEEAAQLRQTTDYLRQELDFEAQVASTGDRTTAALVDKANQDADLTDRRLHRQTNRSTQLIPELV